MAFVAGRRLVTPLVPYRSTNARCEFRAPASAPRLLRVASFALLSSVLAWCLDSKTCSPFGKLVGMGLDSRETYLFGFDSALGFCVLRA
jgi:hypothetical protein